MPDGVKKKWTENKIDRIKRMIDKIDDENIILWKKLKQEIFLLFTGFCFAKGGFATLLFCSEYNKRLRSNL